MFMYLPGSILFLDCVWHKLLEHCTKQASSHFVCWKSVCYQGKYGQYLRKKKRSKITVTV